MKNIVIGIPTYKREILLKKLIRSIFASNLDKDFIDSVDIVVVDNDKLKTAEITVNELKQEIPNQFTIHYFNNSNKGLSNVRNEILRQAYTFNPDFLVCIDDDEYIVEDWLNELTKTIVNNKADIVVGPVLPKFENETPNYISKWFKRKKHSNNEQLFAPIGSGNLILRTAFFKKNNIFFDMRFNSTGAEDTFFSLQAIKNNAKIFFSANAIAYEYFPKSRANINWLFKRYFRGGNTYTYILILEKNYLSLLRKILVNIFSLILGMIILVSVLFPFKNRYYVLLKLIAPSLGSFAAIFNFKYHEYGQNK
ncbi:glycosyltransferase [Zobellia laminariae]|uniref:glycosyltransferase n=1 Tax=Zobellia laminariae TaxID=248906 RepID=UPI0026F41093|nr:glycosyltransferase family 2 protein [Zobellia laminariae]WKX78330.1 glycosyltransferase family 2 protein [Zobellia laminariae]